MYFFFFKLTPHKNEAAFKDQDYLDGRQIEAHKSKLFMFKLHPNGRYFLFYSASLMRLNSCASTVAQNKIQAISFNCSNSVKLYNDSTIK